MAGKKRKATGASSKSEAEGATALKVNKAFAAEQPNTDVNAKPKRKTRKQKQATDDKTVTEPAVSAEATSDKAKVQKQTHTLVIPKIDAKQPSLRPRQAKVLKFQHEKEETVESDDSNRSAKPKKQTCKAKDSVIHSRPFICEEEGCGKAFTQKNNLKRHSIVHSETNTKHFVCEEDGCGRAFTQKANLIRHYLVHSDVRSFICPVNGCKKTCKTKNDLKIHARVHSNAKPFVCSKENCKMAFKSNGELITHLKVHSDARPFICLETGCKKAFKSAGNLAEHKLVHTGVRAFICPEEDCQQKFKLRSALTQHSLIHSGVKRFECNFPLCGRVFNKKGNTLRHINLHLSKKKLEKEAFESEDIDSNFDPLYFLFVDGLQTICSGEQAENISMVDTEKRKSALQRELASVNGSATEKVKKFQEEQQKQLEEEIITEKRQYKTDIEKYIIRVRAETEKSFKEVKLFSNVVNKCKTNTVFTRSN